MSERPARFLHGLVCEEVRREDSGKFIFVGVFPDSVIGAPVPAALVHLTFILYWDVEGRRLPFGKYRLQAPDASVMAEFDLKVPQKEKNAKRVTTMIVVNGVLLAMTGEYRLTARSESGRWRKLFTFKVFDNRAAMASEDSAAAPPPRA